MFTHVRLVFLTDMVQSLDFKKLYEEGKIEFSGDSYIPEESIYQVTATNGEKHKCPHCGKELTPSVLGDYDWQCPDCEEDFYNCELKD